MITITTGNLLTSEAEALVNTVNCVGIMGKGIALQFKQAFPENFADYDEACRKARVVLGRMHVFERRGLFTEGPRFIINFPTKQHWRSRSRVSDIEAGLLDLVSVVRRHDIRSIAIPPLGCGHGGLAWHQVRPLIERAFAELPGVEVLLYAPGAAPRASERPVATQKPDWSRSRALYVAVMDRYKVEDFSLSQLELQKLAYFLQIAGEPLSLRFKRSHFGPYADNLNHVLQRFEGHIVRGFTGDRRPWTELEIIPEAVSEASEFLADYPQSLAHLERVAALIEGFETPYGMELLATTHWVVTHGEAASDDLEAVTAAVHAWNSRKRRLFEPAHIRAALEQLRQQGWLDPSNN